MLEADITEADLMHRFDEFLRKLVTHPPSTEAEQRPPTVEQRPKVETVELAESPRQTLLHSDRSRRRRVLVMSRSGVLAAVALQPKRPILMMLRRGRMGSRVPIWTVCAFSTSSTVSDGSAISS